MKTSNVFLVLAIWASPILGCAAESYRDDADEAELEDFELAPDGSPNDEDVGESQQPILPGQTEIRSSHDRCFYAYSGSVLQLKACDQSSRQSWVIDPNTWLIRSAHFWGKCVAIPKSLTAKLYLDDCDPYDSYQWFPFVPPADGQGLVCSWVLDPNGKPRCATHTGGAYAYTAAPASAPDWYRFDL